MGKEKAHELPKEWKDAIHDSVRLMMLITAIEHSPSVGCLLNTLMEENITPHKDLLKELKKSGIYVPDRIMSTWEEEE